MIANNTVGSVEALYGADADSASAVRAEYVYSAYGEVMMKSGDLADKNNITYSTRYREGNTGLVGYTYRHYSPRLKTWINKDPIAEQGGVNLYQMIGNQPMNYWDNLGLCAGECKFGERKFISDRVVSIKLEKEGEEILRNGREAISATKKLPVCSNSFGSVLKTILNILSSSSNIEPNYEPDNPNPTLKQLGTRKYNYDLTVAVIYIECEKRGKKLKWSKNLEKTLTKHYKSELNGGPSYRDAVNRLKYNLRRSLGI